MARRMLALLTALLLVASLPLSALAAEWSLDNGDVTVSVNEQGTQHVSQGENKKEDAAPTITGGNGSQTITVSATGENKANLTIENVNAKTIDVGSSNATITVSGENNKVSNNNGAGIHVSSGDLTITGDGTLNVNAQGKFNQSAGIGSNCNEDMSGNITIKDNVTVNAVAGTSDEYATSGGASIGSGRNGEMSGSITIGDTADVTATTYGGMDLGAGIGSGYSGEMSGTISISTKANVTAKSVNKYGEDTAANDIGAGNIGSMTGTIQYFDPDPAPTQPAKTPLYRVLNERGEPLSCTKELADGVLTITVDADFAKLIGTVLSLKTLEKQGVTSITLVTGSATSTFALADLQAKGTGTYTLTHDKETVTFTLAKTDVSDILK